MNGDSIADVPLKALVEYHTQKRAVATIALAEVPDVARYGAVVLGPDGQIVRFKEKSVEGKGWVNAGIYVLEREVVANIPSERQVSLERDVFERLTGCGLYGFPFNGFFIDVGTPEAYNEAQLELPGRFLC
jgi:NDP-sugar pyrophosphorylase family protein